MDERVSQDIDVDVYLCRWISRRNRDPKIGGFVRMGSKAQEQWWAVHQFWCKATVKIAGHVTQK